jgi:hypothetical protein
VAQAPTYLTAVSEQRQSCTLVADGFLYIPLRMHGLDAQYLPLLNLSNI